MTKQKIQNWIKISKELRHSSIGASKLISMLTATNLNMFVAVDYQIIHKYLYYSFEDIIYYDNNDRDFVINKSLLEFVTRRFIFEIFPKFGDVCSYGRNNPLVLLPSYAEEMNDIVTKITKKRMDQAFNIGKLHDKIDRLKIKYNSIRLNENNRKHSRKDLIELVSILDEFYLIFKNRINYSKKIICDDMHLGWPNSLPFPEYNSISDDYVSDTYNIFKSLRPDPIKELSNYRDSVAFEYLLKINNDLNIDNACLLLISDSPVTHLAYKQILKRFKPNRFSNMFLYSTFDFSTFLICLSGSISETKQNYINYSSKLKNLVSRNLAILNSYKLKCVNNDNDNGEFFSFANRAIQKISDELVNFMKISLFEHSANDSLKGNIFDKIYIGQDEIENEIWASIKDIISSSENDISQSYYELINNDLFLLASVCGGYKSPITSTFDSYFFTEYTYDDPEVQKLAMDLDPLEQLNSLDSLKKLHSLVNHNNLEAILLMLHLQSRAGFDDLKLVEVCIDQLKVKNEDISRKLYFHFNFLKNIFMARSNRLRESLLNSKRIAELIGNEQPRFLLQAGYYNYRMWEEVNEIMFLDDAIRTTMDAYNYSNNIKFINCNVISISNLINCFIDKKDYKKASQYYNLLNSKLSNSIYKDKIYYVPFFSYIIGLYAYHVIKNNCDNPWGNLDDALKELDNSIILLKSAKRMASKYFRERYLNLIRLADELRR